MTQLIHQTLTLDKIDPTLDEFRISTDENIDGLARSIQTIGLIHAPIVKKHGESYCIISGFRRLEALRLAGFSEIPVMAADALSPLGCAEVAVAENAYQRDLNTLEQARAVSLLSRYEKDKNRLMKKAGQVLNIPPNPSLIDKLLTIGRLPGKVQCHVKDNTLSMAVALELAEMDEATAVKFAELFSTLRMSLNKQRELITLVTEISLRDEMTPVSVFKNSGLDCLMENPDLERNAKTRIIRETLKKLRFPQLTKAEERFRSLSEKLELGDGMQFLPPKEFEGTVYNLVLSFDSLGKLNQMTKKLSEITNGGVMDKILARND